MLATSSNIMYKRVFITGELYEGEYSRRLAMYKQAFAKIKGDKTGMPEPDYWEQMQPK